MRAILIALLAGTLLACSQGTEYSTPDDGVSDQSLGTDKSISAPPVGPRGETSLEERIANYPFVVKARMTSESIEVVAGGGRLLGKFFPVFEFELAVAEYLNGTGANKITAIWGYSSGFDTRQEAEDALPGIRASRDTQWDTREAIFFLQHVRDAQDILDVFPTLRGDSSYYLSWTTFWHDNYSLSSENKLWLPAAADSSGVTGQGAPPGDSQEFLLAAPTGPPSGGVSGASGPADSTITLGDLKKRIAAVKAEMNAGDGSKEYRECVRLMYQYEREDKWHKEEGNGLGVFHTTPSHKFDSGQPAGTMINEGEVGGAVSSEKRSKLWFDGPDAALLKVVTGDLEPGEYAPFKFTQTLVSVRPIPAGEYSAKYNLLVLSAIPCNHVFSYEMRVTVTAPDSTMHEAFFDPVAIGQAVGADATNGVLKPVAFSLTEGGSTASLGKIAWESEQAMLEIAPSISLAGYHADFISLDGSVSLRLDFDDASETTEEAKRTFTWNVCKQPWKSENLLMLRMSRSGEELTGVTNDGPCNQPPVFDSSSYSYSVAEDAATSTAVGKVSATDSDQGDAVSYSVTAGNDAGKFAIGSSNGQITVADALDYETASSYTLTVEASDGRGGMATTTVAIAVTDVAENSAPSFGSSSYSFSVAEDAATSTAVGTVSATDSDEGDTVSYSVTAGNDAGKFAIGSSNGQITVAGTLDYETVSSYTLTVEASDGNDGTATATVAITVTDVSED